MGLPWAYRDSELGRILGDDRIYSGCKDYVGLIQGGGIEGPF